MNEPSQGVWGAAQLRAGLGIRAWGRAVAFGLSPRLLAGKGAGQISWSFGRSQAAAPSRGWRRLGLAGRRARGGVPVTWVAGGETARE